MQIKKIKRRRSDTKVVTKEGRLLKFLRESRSLSMRQAGVSSEYACIYFIGNAAFVFWACSHIKVPFLRS